MAANLTAGAIAKMLSGEVKGKEEMTPILQVMEIKMIQQARRNQEQSVERYKVAVSDGIQSQEDMLSAASNVLVKQGSIKLGSILRLIRFNCSPVRNSKLWNIDDCYIAVGRELASGPCGLRYICRLFSENWPQVIVVSSNV
ncbi:hypothetical protein Bca4012_009493 [Brassica carinata]